MEPATEQTHTEPQWLSKFRQLHPAIVSITFVALVLIPFFSVRSAFGHWDSFPLGVMFIPFFKLDLFELSGKELLKRSSEFVFWTILLCLVEAIRSIPVRIAVEFFVLIVANWRWIAKSRAMQLAEQLESQ